MVADVSSVGTNVVVRLYFWSRHLVARAVMSVHACFDGIWLGLLSADELRAIDEAYYNQEDMYVGEEYNRRGLWAWERESLEQFFAGRKRLLVAGAGGGREVLALRELGYDAIGFECNARLVDFANNLLSAQGVGGEVLPAARDEVPLGLGRYDGIIVGWGAYMLIMGREARIDFLRSLRQYVSDDGPILMSFFTRSEDRLFFRVNAAIANLLRAALGRQRLEVGDALSPNYVHCFTEREVSGELAEAGFELVSYETRDYGRAVGIARPC